MCKSQIIKISNFVIHDYKYGQASIVVISYSTSVLKEGSLRLANHHSHLRLQPTTKSWCEVIDTQLIVFTNICCHLNYYLFDWLYQENTIQYEDKGFGKLYCYLICVFPFISATNYMSNNQNIYYLPDIAPFLGDVCGKLLLDGVVP